MSLFEEDFPALSPVQFFGLTAECQFIRGSLKPEKAYLLPSTSDLLNEEPFADLYSAWNFEKLYFHIEVHRPFQKVMEADFRKGDSVELFIDTRDLKTRGVITQFCHHYVIYPIETQNYFGREITRFRNEDTHRLCHPEDLLITPELRDNSYALSIEIPARCLHGYDPLSFSRIGFTYRINRYEGASQHFAVSSEEYIIEQHPATWGTLKLLKNGE